jgi:hypothetical protein
VQLLCDLCAGSVQGVRELHAHNPQSCIEILENGKAHETFRRLRSTADRDTALGSSGPARNAKPIPPPPTWQCGTPPSFCSITAYLTNDLRPHTTVPKPPPNLCQLAHTPVLSRPTKQDGQRSECLSQLPLGAFDWEAQFCNTLPVFSGFRKGAGPQNPEGRESFLAKETRRRAVSSSRRVAGRTIGSGGRCAAAFRSRNTMLSAGNRFREGQGGQGGQRLAALAALPSRYRAGGPVAV